MKTLFKVSIFTIILSGCTAIYFQSPQPNGVTELTSFPNNLQGRYMLDGDTVEIRKTHYSYQEDFKRIIPLSELNENNDLKIINDLLYDYSLDSINGFSFREFNDSVSYSGSYTEFNYISDSLVIKTYKKKIFLSMREDSKTYYQVYYLKQKGKNFILYAVGDFQADDEEEDERKDGFLSEYWDFTEFNKIGDKEYLIDPSQEELQQLLKNDFFVKTMVLKRID